MMDVWCKQRQMSPPDDLVWTHILGVLIGQADGEVFVPQAAVVAVEQFDLEIEGSLERDGWYVRLKPRLNDGSQSQENES